MSEGAMSKHDRVLVGLVAGLQANALQQLGKIKNPFTDELERDLDAARATIDVLEMLKEKCRQGTPDEVLKLLDGTLMDLQMNYLDELKKGSPGEGEDAPPEDPEAAADDEAGKE